MHDQQISIKSFFIITFCCLLFFIGPSISATSQTGHTSISFEDRIYLITLFEKEGYDREFLTKIFNHKKLNRIPIVIARNINNTESRRSYADFYSAYSMRKAYRFSKKWNSVLNRAAKHFNVDKEILVSILLVETGLGNVLGRYPVISVFSSILLKHNDIASKDSQMKNMSEDDQFIFERIMLKSEWAKNEMIALLKIIENTKHHPFYFKGSYAGAFGIPQFLPSSYLKWGYDSDDNGSINLYLIPDAIFSTANYLKAHGWKKGLYRESNKDVLFQYNHSRLYVETVLNIAIKIKNYCLPVNKTKKKQNQFLRTKENNCTNNQPKTVSTEEKYNGDV